MKIMVIGSGGREHCIIHALNKSPLAETIYALPGNGGIAAEAVCMPVKATDIDSVVKFAVENKIDFAVVAPDDPLVLGAVDALEEAGIPAFGPGKKAAAIEGSKIFSKNLMKKYGIPTAAYETFDSEEAAKSYLKTCSYPAVIKADGLALGKGVIIAQNYEEAAEAVYSMMTDKVFGSSGSHIVIEEFLSGPEVTVLSFTDGKTIVPMVSSMDHKRAGDNNTGLNTGGMGTIAPNPYYTEEIAERCMREIFLPTVEAMNKEGRTFKGCLYFGLMLTPDGPKVIEYNCRFGDPEAQVVLPLMKTDLLEVMRAVQGGRLSEINVEFDKKAACCVVLASEGYPVKYETGFPIDFGKTKDKENVFVYNAGTRLDENGVVVTSGGRVLGVTAVKNTLRDAVKLAYESCGEISFKNKYSRNDIGLAALTASEDAK